MTNPVDAAFPAASPGARGDVVDFLKERFALVAQSVAEVNGDDFSGHWYILVRATGRVYEYNSGSSASDDGVTVLVDSAGNRFTLAASGIFNRGAPVTKTANFTVGAAENHLICNKASSLTVTLPAAATWTGREILIRTIQAQTVVSASSNVVPLIGGSASTAILAAADGAWALLVSDGTNWQIMAGA